MCDTVQAAHIAFPSNQGTCLPGVRRPSHSRVRCLPQIAGSTVLRNRGQAHSHREKRRTHCRRCIQVSCVRQVFGRGASGSCGGGGRGGPLALARVAVATVSFLVCPRGAAFRLGGALLRLRRCGRLLAVGCGLLHLDLVRVGIRVRVGIVVRVGVGDGLGSSSSRPAMSRASDARCDHARPTASRRRRCRYTWSLGSSSTRALPR